LTIVLIREAFNRLSTSRKDRTVPIAPAEPSTRDTQTGVFESAAPVADALLAGAPDIPLRFLAARMARK
jgi:hypothetical protein